MALRPSFGGGRRHPSRSGHASEAFRLLDSWLRTVVRWNYFRYLMARLSCSINLKSPQFSSSPFYK